MKRKWDKVDDDQKNSNNKRFKKSTTNVGQSIFSAPTQFQVPDKHVRCKTNPFNWDECEDLIFQVSDIQCTSLSKEKVLNMFRGQLGDENVEILIGREEEEELPRSSSQQQWTFCDDERVIELPSVQLFGVTEDGCTVMTTVFGDLPYFYIQLPQNFSSHCDMLSGVDEQLEMIRSECNEYLADKKMRFPTKHTCNPDTFYEIFDETIESYLHNNRFYPLYNIIKDKCHQKDKENRKQQTNNHQWWTKKNNLVGRYYKEKEMNEEMDLCFKPIDSQNNFGDYVLDIELVGGDDDLLYVNLYAPRQSKNDQFAKVTMASPRYVKLLRSWLEQDENDIRLKRDNDLSGCLPEFKSFSDNLYVDWKPSTFESNFEYILRVTIDNDWNGCQWFNIRDFKSKSVVVVDDDQYTTNTNNYIDNLLHSSAPLYKKQSYQQIELLVHYGDILTLNQEEWKQKLAPFRRLSYDIECNGEDVFPTPDRHPVIQIGFVVNDFQRDNEITERTGIFALKSCATIQGSDVYWFDDEVSLLEAWRQFVVALSPEIITGYNINNFDYPYLLDRARALGYHQFDDQTKLKRRRLKVEVDQVVTGSGASSKAREKKKNEKGKSTGSREDIIVHALKKSHPFSSFSIGRLAKKQPINKKTSSTKQQQDDDDKLKKKENEKNMNKKVISPGNLILDMYVGIVKLLTQKYKSYKLGYVSQKVIGDTKADLAYDMIGPLQRGTAEDRKKIAVYCIKDSVLPLRIMEKFKLLENQISTAIIIGLPLYYLIWRGKSVQIQTHLYSGVMDHFLNNKYDNDDDDMNVCVDVKKVRFLGRRVGGVRKRNNRKHMRKRFLVPFFKKKSVGDKFKGAIVVDPIKGFHTNPISTLDFKSLYPSIMIAYNLCYTTLVSEEKVTFIIKEKDLAYPLNEEQVNVLIKTTKSTSKTNVKIQNGIDYRSFKKAFENCSQHVRILVSRQFGNSGGGKRWKKINSINGYISLPTFFNSVESNQQKYLTSTRDGQMLNCGNVFPNSILHSGGMVKISQKENYLVHFDEDMIEKLEKLKDSENINVTPIGCVFESNRLVESEHYFTRGGVGYKLNEEQSACFDELDRIDYHRLKRAFLTEDDSKSKCKPNTLILWCDGKNMVPVVDFFQKIDKNPNEYMTTSDHTSIWLLNDVFFPMELSFNYKNQQPNDADCRYLIRVSSQQSLHKVYTLFEDNPQVLDISPNGCISDKSRVGIVPHQLTKLLKARSAAKKKMAEYPHDSFMWHIYNGFQVALKVTCNSYYGFTGTSVGALPCKQISESVTSYGRQMIEKTTEVVESHFTMNGGYRFDSRVIYGDTDSVMIDFGPITLDEAFLLADEASRIMNLLFVEPNELEFEKIYSPYLLLKKKKYAGWKIEPKFRWNDEQGWMESIPPTEKAPKMEMDCKGIETVRRDICDFVSITLGHTLDYILKENNVPKAVRFIKEQVGKLYAEEIDYSFLLLSAGLNRPISDYKTPTPHSVVAKKVNRINPGTYKVGSRVPYLFVKGLHDGDNKGEKAEDPTWVMKNKDMRLNAGLYLEKLELPVRRIMGPILSERRLDEIFKGQHVKEGERRLAERMRIDGQCHNNKSSYFGFEKIVQAQCEKCHKKISDQKLVFCKECKKDRQLIMKVVVHKMNKMKVAERECNSLWNTCAVCKNDRLDPTKCTSIDSCPIFFIRQTKLDAVEKLKKEIKNCQSLEW